MNITKKNSILIKSLFFYLNETFLQEKITIIPGLGDLIPLSAFIQKYKYLADLDFDKICENQKFKHLADIDFNTICENQKYKYLANIDFNII